MSSFLKRYHDRLINLVLWLIVLVPLLGCGRLMRKYCVDQRFLDDWVWAIDLAKFSEGELTVHDIFSVHLEHRPALPRALALGVTLLAKGDVRAQNGLTFLWMASAFGALCWLWMRRARLGIREVWMPLLLAGGVMLTPVQWENLLWPVCCETMMPFLFLLLALCCAFTAGPWWTRCLVGGGCAILGMLSFASGVLLWFLPLPVFIFCGAFVSARQRWRFAALWAAVFAVTMLIYLQVQIVRHDQVTTVQKHLVSLPGNLDLVYDLHNEVPPQYAYHHGAEDTMGGSMAYFIGHPSEALQFVAIFSGALSVRGWAANTLTAALIVGFVYLAGLTLLAWSCWWFRREKDLLANLLPMVCLAAYTPATGLLVAVGRLYAGHLYAALNTRYHVHQTQIVIGLVGGAFFLARHFFQGRPSAAWRTATIAAGGALAGIIGVGWFFGTGMMQAWQCARLRNQAAQYVSQIIPGYNYYVAWIAGSHPIAQSITGDLAKAGLLQLPPLKSRQFSEFGRKIRINEHPLDSRHAVISRLQRVASGKWEVEGYASLPVSNRLADGVLLAWRVPGGEWTIWGFTQPNGLPSFLAQSMGKDMWGIVPGHDFWPARAMCQLEDEVAVVAQPPPGAQLSAWVMDMQKRQILRITRDKSGTVDEDGLTAEEFAKPYEPPPGGPAPREVQANE